MLPYRTVAVGHLGAPAPCPASAERERERAASIFPISIISCYDCAPECSHSVSQRPWPATRKFVLRLDDRIGNSRSRQSMHSVERAGAGVSYRCFLLCTGCPSRSRTLVGLTLISDVPPPCPLAQPVLPIFHQPKQK